MTAEPACIVSANGIIALGPKHARKRMRIGPTDISTEGFMHAAALGVGVCPLHKCASDGSLLMPRAEGTLEQAVAHGWLAGEALPHLAQELLAALARLHRGGIIHADVKPNNVLVSRWSWLLAQYSLLPMLPKPLQMLVGSYLPPLVWLADFGLASPAWAPVAYGTPTFSAPENRLRSCAVDLWSAGATLGYAGEMLKPPRPAEWRHAVRGLMRREPARRLTAAQAVVHPAFQPPCPCQPAESRTPPAQSAATNVERKRASVARLKRDASADKKRHALNEASKAFKRAKFSQGLGAAMQEAEAVVATRTAAMVERQPRYILQHRAKLLDWVLEVWATFARLPLEAVELSINLIDASFATTATERHLYQLLGVASIALVAHLCGCSYAETAARMTNNTYHASEIARAAHMLSRMMRNKEGKIEPMLRLVCFGRRKSEVARRTAIIVALWRAQAARLGVAAPVAVLLVAARWFARYQRALAAPTNPVWLRLVGLDAQYRSAAGTFPILLLNPTESHVGLLT